MSHAREIRNKQDLQTRLQLSLASTTAHVSSWLNTSTTKNNNIHNTSIDLNNDPSKDEFFNLPIISGGSGLSLSIDQLQQEDINTIGDYVKTGKSLTSLKNKKIRQPSSNNKNSLSNRITKPKIVSDSKALNALRNKIRNDDRKKRNNNNNNNEYSKPIETKKIDNEDSDSEEEQLLQKSTKKKYVSLLDAKMKKRK